MGSNERLADYGGVLSGLKLVLQADTDRNKLKIAINWFYRLYYDIATFGSEIARIAKTCPLQLEGYSEREVYNWYMLMEEVWDAIVNTRSYKKGEPPPENAEVFKLASEMCVRIKALEKRIDRDFSWLRHQDPVLFARLVDTVGFFIDERSGILSITKEVAQVHLYDNILSERYRYRPPGSNLWREWRWSIPDRILTTYLDSLKPLDVDQIKSILANVKSYVEGYEGRVKSLSKGMKDALEQANFEFLTLEEYDEILKEREDTSSNIILNIGEVVRERAGLASPKGVTHYHSYYGEVHMGDVFEGISNSTIVSRSSLEGAFNRLQDGGQSEGAKLLVEIGKRVSDANNAGAGAVYSKMAEELSNPAQDKNVVKSYWDGLVAILPSLADLSAAVIKAFVT